MNIQKASLADLETLQHISKQTFVETFAAFNTPENMKHYLEENLAKDTLKQELENPDSHFYLAYKEKELVGYLKINFGNAQTENTGEYGMEIERIYILSAYHGKKLGQQLYDYAIELARQQAVPFVWLGVWEKNLRAIQFYKKNGFVEFDKHIFQLGDDAQTDIMMRLELG